MNVAAVCSRTVFTVDHAAPLPEAARLMRQHHVGSLVVTQPTAEGTAVAGIVTDRDLAVEVLARAIDGTAVRIGQLVRPPLVGVPETASIDEAIALMQQHGVRRLLVSGAGGQLTGIVTLDDVLGALAARLAALAQVVKAGLEREAHERPAVTQPPIPAVRIPAVGTAGWTQPTGG